MCTVRAYVMKKYIPYPYRNPLHISLIYNRHEKQKSNNNMHIFASTCHLGGELWSLQREA